MNSRLGLRYTQKKDGSWMNNRLGLRREKKEKKRWELSE